MNTHNFSSFSRAHVNRLDDCNTYGQDQLSFRLKNENQTVNVYETRMTTSISSKVFENPES